MKKLLIAAAVTGAAALALRHSARKGHKLSNHCCDMMRDHCHDTIAGRQPQ